MIKPKIMMISVRADHGGGPRHIYQLVRNLDSDFEIFIACPKEKPYWELFHKILGDTHLFEIPHRSFRLNKLRELKNFILTHSIRLIHSHGKGAGLYGRLLSRDLKVPNIHTFHGLHIDNYSFLQKWMYLKLERWLCKHSRACISVSESEKKRILENKIVSSESLKLIFNGIQPISQKHFLNMEPRVICITRDDPVKNPDLVIKIAKILPEFKFRIVGIESSQKWTQKLISADNIELLGLLSEETLAQHFEWASICLNTSLWEGLPLSLLEAMSHQVAIVATNVPGNSDLLADSGWKFKSNDAHAGANAIKRCLSDPLDYERRVNSAYAKIVEKFSETVMSERTSIIYHQNI